MGWETLAETALTDPKPITADATNITKFGAPAAAIATALLTAFGVGVMPDANLDEAVIGAAIVIAAVMLGVYHAFASDLRTRGALAIKRLEVLAALAAADIARDERFEQDAVALSLAIAARDAALADSQAAQAELAGYREAAQAAQALAQAEALALPPAPVAPPAAVKSKKSKKNK